MTHIPTFALAALAAVVLAVPAQAAGPAAVDVQVEGAAGAALPTTTVTTTTTPVNKDGQAGHECPGTSAAGALEVASGGDWEGPWYSGLGYAVERVHAETARFSDGKYFNLYVNGQVSNSGLCGTELQAGDDVLLYVACAGASSGCYAEEPLFATAPRTVAPGAAFTVRVREATSTQNPDFTSTTTLTPSQGASVDGTPTGADGTAQIALAHRGAQLVVVTKGGRPPERVPVCVTDGADGFCGTARRGEPAAGGGSAGAQPAPAPASAVVRGRITSIAEGRTFRRGRVPRLLRGTVPSAGTGVEEVRLRLTRNDRGRCFTYDDDTERQRRLSRCGAARGEWFTIGDRADWEYQLAFSLPRGRWVLDLQVRDRDGRTSRLERGGTRVVFRVR